MTTSERCSARPSSSASASARPPFPAGSSRSAASVSRRPRRPWRGRRQRGSLGAERDEPEPVPAPRRGVADRERDAFGHVGLAPLGRAERHRGRRVEDEPGDEDALGELDADVRLAGAGGDVPVDPADVVAGLVRAHLVAARSRRRRRPSGSRRPGGRRRAGRSRARAPRGSRAVIAPGAGPSGRPLRPCCGYEPFHATAVAGRPRSIWGGAKAASTWSST